MGDRNDSHAGEGMELHAFGLEVRHGGQRDVGAGPGQAVHGPIHGFRGHAKPRGRMSFVHPPKRVEQRRGRTDIVDGDLHQRLHHDSGAPEPIPDESRARAG